MLSLHIAFSEGGLTEDAAEVPATDNATSQQVTDVTLLAIPDDLSPSSSSTVSASSTTTAAVGSNTSFVEYCVSHSLFPDLAEKPLGKLSRHKQKKRISSPAPAVSKRSSKVGKSHDRIKHRHSASASSAGESGLSRYAAKVKSKLTGRGKSGQMVHAKFAQDESACGPPPPPPQPLNIDLDMPVDPNEPRYCICQRVSFGEMIGCDDEEVCPVELEPPKNGTPGQNHVTTQRTNQNLVLFCLLRFLSFCCIQCQFEWFHKECVGFPNVGPDEKWYCPECRKKHPI